MTAPSNLEEELELELELVRRRLRYRSSHRGTKELDFILGRFCDAHVDGFDLELLHRVETLLEHEETVLQQWLMGQVSLPEGAEGELLAQIRAFHLNELGAPS